MAVSIWNKPNTMQNEPDIEIRRGIKYFGFGITRS